MFEFGVMLFAILFLTFVAPHCFNGDTSTPEPEVIVKAVEKVVEVEKPAKRKRVR